MPPEDGGIFIVHLFWQKYYAGWQRGNDHHRGDPPKTLFIIVGVSFIWLQILLQLTIGL